MIVPLTMYNYLFWWLIRLDAIFFIFSFEGCVCYKMQYFMLLIKKSSLNNVQSRISTYKNRIRGIDQVTDEISNLSNLEKRLVQDQDLIQLRGKVTNYEFVFLDEIMYYCPGLLNLGIRIFLLLFNFFL